MEILISIFKFQKCNYQKRYRTLVRSTIFPQVRFNKELKKKKKEKEMFCDTSDKSIICIPEYHWFRSAPKICRRNARNVTVDNRVSGLSPLSKSIT